MEDLKAKDFERMLYDISEQAADQSEDITNRLNPIDRIYSYIMWGIILMFAELLLLINGTTSHLLIIVGAICIINGCNIGKWSSKKLFLAHVLWIVLLVCLCVYDVGYFMYTNWQLDIIWEYFPGITEEFRRMEMLVLQVLINYTLISLIMLMHKMVASEASRAERIKNLLAKGLCSYIQASLVIAIVFMINMQGKILVTILLLYLLIIGKKNLNEARNNIMFSGFRSINWEAHLRKNRILFQADTIIVTGMTMLLLGIWYAPYITDKPEHHINYIDNEDRWVVYNQEKGITKAGSIEIAEEKPQDIDVDTEVEKIKKNLISLGVREDVLDSMLQADILRLGDTKRVLQSVHEGEMEDDVTRWLKEDNPDDDTIEIDSIKYRATIYACEIFNGYEFDEKNSKEKDSDLNKGSYIYEVLIYVELLEDGREIYKNKALMIQSRLGNQGSVDSDIMLKHGNENINWVYLTETDGETRYYTGIEPSDPAKSNWIPSYLKSFNLKPLNCSLTYIPKGENYRAYKVGRMYVKEEDFDSNNYIDLNIATVNDGKYYDYGEGKMVYGFGRTKNHTACLYALRIIRTGHEENVAEYKNRDDYYDDGYDASKKINNVLIDVYSQ